MVAATTQYETRGPGSGARDRGRGIGGRGIGGGRRQPAGITGHCNPPGGKGIKGEAMDSGPRGGAGNEACWGGAGIRGLTEGRREKTE